MSENDTDNELEELRRKTNRGDRLDTDAGSTDKAALVADLRVELEALDAGERQKTVSVWDGHLAALFAVLEERDDDREKVADALREELGAPGGGDSDRSEVLRLALRLGLREAAPEYLDALRDAVRDHSTPDY